MFYETSGHHGLERDPFKAIITPRPIGWISTVDSSGRPNIAPYSFFNAVGTRPHMLAFGSGELKDSARNARDTGEFVFNLVTLPQIEKMNLTSRRFEEGVNEFERANVEVSPCRIVRAPRVTDSPASLECRVVHFMELTDINGEPTDNYLTIGQVVGVHISDDYVRNGRFDAQLAQTVARCGYHDYLLVDDLFELESSLIRVT